DDGAALLEEAKHHAADGGDDLELALLRYVAGCWAGGAVLLRLGAEQGRLGLLELETRDILRELGGSHFLHGRLLAQAGAVELFLAEGAGLVEAEHARHLALRELEFRLGSPEAGVGLCQG